MLRITAELAQVFNAAWMGSDTASFKALLSDLEAACDRAGRDLKSIEVTVGLLALPVETDAELDSMLERLRPDSSYIGKLTLQDLRRKAICGGPEQLAEQFRAYLDAGADHLVIAPSPDAGSHIDDERIDIIAAAVEMLRS